MTIRSLTSILVTTLFVFALPVSGTAAHEHHHYKLIDIGTFGGPRNYFNTDDTLSPYLGASQDLNNAGALAGWADTSTSDPFAPNCFNGGCYVSHAFVWRNGHMKDLGVLPGGASSATTWISANGLIAGASQNGELDPQSSPPGFPQNRAVLWRDGKIVDLGTLQDEGGFQSGAEAVNSRGQVVGWTQNRVPDPYSMGASSNFYNFYQPIEYYQMRAFIWQDGVMQDLGTLGTGTDAFAMAINERGQVTGIAYTNSTPNEVVTDCNSQTAAPIPTVEPFLWENGTMIDLGSLGGVCGIPFWIDNSGQVVGESYPPSNQGSHAFLWRKDEGMEDLGTLGGLNSVAVMINESGSVVGGSDTPTGEPSPHAFLWNGSMHDLGALNGCASTAWGINARGQVVGNSGVGPGCPTQIGFLWEKGGPMVDLNSLLVPGPNPLVIAAIEINDQGEISVAGCPVGADLTCAFLLIPCDDNHPDIQGCDYSPMEVHTVAAGHVTEATSQKQLTPQGSSRIRALPMSRDRGFMPRTIH